MPRGEPRNEVYQLRLSTSEKDYLTALADERGTTIVGLIRQEFLENRPKPPQSNDLTEFHKLVAQHETGDL